MSNRKFSGNISGKGYYIALVLCAVAIGITGYLYYRNTNKPQDSLEAQTPVAEIQQEDVPAVATKPSQQDQEETPTTQPTAPKTMKTVAPVSGETVSAYAVDCLSYNETTRDWRTHNGMDIAAEEGTPVLAAADGTVYTVYEDDTMGTTVVIRHAEGYVTKYASLASDVAVAPGDTVTLGQKIGTVGNTALLESAIGTHVHFSVLQNDTPLDPNAFLSLS